MKDRVSTYPGRVKLTAVSGQANTYDMERADSPTEAGTALNKANLFDDTTATAYRIYGTAGSYTSVSTPNEAFASIPLYQKIWTAQSYSSTQIRVYCDRFAYVDGASVTFKSDVTNNGATTRISIRGIGWKYVYKEGTASDAPTIVTGRVYTVWYDATNDCFFVKAGGAVTLTPGDGYHIMTLLSEYSINKAVPSSLQAVYRVVPSANVTGSVSVSVTVYQDTTTPVIYKIGSNAQGTQSGSTSINISETVDFSKPFDISIGSPTGINVKLYSVSVVCGTESFCTGAAL